MFVCFYLLILVFYRIISQGNFCYCIFYLSQVFTEYEAIWKQHREPVKISDLQYLESSLQLVREALELQAPEGGQIIDKHSHEKAFLKCSLFCISLIEKMSENGITVFLKNHHYSYRYKSAKMRKKG